jgi:hypothetical protein
MAASVYVPSRSLDRLAPVIPLRAGAAGAARPAVRVAPETAPQVEVEAPALRLVVTDRRVFLRRRIAVVAVALVVALVGAVIGLGVASASAPEPTVGGHVVLQPGETLWDVAVRSAPHGVDARRQLADIRRINGFSGGTMDAWTVVLLPG